MFVLLNRALRSESRTASQHSVIRVTDSEDKFIETECDQHSLKMRQDIWLRARHSQNVAHQLPVLSARRRGVHTSTPEARFVHVMPVEPQMTRVWHLGEQRV
jgi:hypothetical protein